MKQKKNRVVKKEDIRIPDKKDQFVNLIMRFILTVIILVLLFVVNYFYNKKFDPVKLTKLQYHYYKEVEDSPEKNLIGDELSYAESLSQCPPGYCSINKNSGIKRCPNGDHQLVYNTVLEGCTRKFFCDLDELKYSVNTDGSTNSDGRCEEDVVCRCSRNKSCDNSITDTFQIEYSSSNIDPSKNNFTILPSSKKINQYGNLPLEIEDPEVEFCKINPGFTDKIVFGCNFDNSVNDKLGCDLMSTLVESQRDTTGSEKTYVSAALSSRIKIGDTSFVSILSPDLSFVKSKNPDLYYPLARGPREGYLLIEQDTVKEFVLYTNYFINSEKNTLTVEGIIHLFTEVGGVTKENSSFPYGTVGFENNFNLTCKIKSYFIDNLNCIVPSQGSNYKNMLLCTQNKNKICKNGTLSYNYDKLNGKDMETPSELLTEENFVRNFCQKNITVENSLKINNNFLNDPSFYTMSCHLGSGCNDKNLTLGLLKGPEAGPGKYYSDFDIDGINGTWDLLTTTFPLFTPKKDADDTYLLNQETIEPGDYWAVKSSPVGLFTNLESEPGSCTIFVSSLLSLNQYVGTKEIDEDYAPFIKFLTKGDTTEGGTCFRVTECDYGTSGFQIKVNIPGGFTSGVSSNIPVQVLPIDYSKRDNSYGVVLKTYYSNVPTRIFFSGYGNLYINPESKDKTINLEIFKQFSFNGANYNTVVGWDEYESRYRRYYSSNSGKPIYYNNGTSIIYPPQNQNNLFLQVRGFASYESINSPEYLNFQNRNADFKIPMSMYYPVWNPTVFKQECIKCKPFLLTYVNTTIDQKIDNVVIQYSGKDFKNYEYNFKNKNFCYTSISKLIRDSSNIENTSRTLFLEEANNDIRVGDYVMNSSLKLPIEILLDDSGSGPDNHGPNLQLYNRLEMILDNDIGFFSYGKEESTREDIIYKSKILHPEGAGVFPNNDTDGWRLLISRTYPPKNYFFGKIYQWLGDNWITPVGKNYSTRQNRDKGFYFIPTVKVTNISEDKKIVTTDSPLLFKLNVNDDDEYIQFCRLDTSLDLKVVEDINKDTNTIASGGQVAINRISDGRITNIIVKNPGKNYERILKPTIVVDNYF